MVNGDPAEDPVRERPRAPGPVAPGTGPRLRRRRAPRPLQRLHRGGRRPHIRRRRGGHPGRDGGRRSRARRSSAGAGPPPRSGTCSRGSSRSRTFRWRATTSSRPRRPCSSGDGRCSSCSSRSRRRPPPSSGRRSTGSSSACSPAPVTRGDILWSKFLYGVCLGLVQLVVLFLAGEALYGIEIGGHIGLLVVVCVFAAAACTSFGMLIAAVSPTAESARGICHLRHPAHVRRRRGLVPGELHAASSSRSSAG